MREDDLKNGEIHYVQTPQNHVKSLCYTVTHKLKRLAINIFEHNIVKNENTLMHKNEIVK